MVWKAHVWRGFRDKAWACKSGTFWKNALRTSRVSPQLEAWALSPSSFSASENKELLGRALAGVGGSNWVPVRLINSDGFGRLQVQPLCLTKRQLHSHLVPPDLRPEPAQAGMNGRRSGALMAGHASPSRPHVTLTDNRNETRCPPSRTTISSVPSAIGLKKLPKRQKCGIGRPGSTRRQTRVKRSPSTKRRERRRDSDHVPRLKARTGPSRDARVLAAGGGVIGACTAFYLARRGAALPVVKSNAVACAASVTGQPWCVVPDEGALERLTAF